ncbi:MAG: hypothetical protein ACFE7R_05530, partial [Candidatus Hodarchaeota archaeon]
IIVAAQFFYRVGVGKFGGGKAAALLGVFVGIALCILPALVMIEFIPQYVEILNLVMVSWTDYWIHLVYGFAQCLVNALSFGAPVYFIFFAAQQYDRGLYGEIYTKTPTSWIRVGELMIFTIFLFVYLPPIETLYFTIPFMNRSDIFSGLINWISLGITVIMVLVKFALGTSDNSTMGGPSNILVVGLFLIVELFFKTNLLLITLIIWLAFLIFGAVMAANFARASPREMY